MKIYYVVLITCILLLQNNAYSQDISVQHIQDDVTRTGKTNSSFTPVASLSNAFVLPNNNRKTHAGIPGSGGTLNGDDMSGAVRLSSTSTVDFMRVTSSINANMRFNSSIVEYVGKPNGPNEFIVRDRLTVDLNDSNNNVLQTVTGINNPSRCIPFITGILNSSSIQDADSGTAIAYLENSNDLRVLKGSPTNDIRVYITLVEFTGTNWSVLHGNSGFGNQDSGNIFLSSNSNGSGVTSGVTDWSNTIIFGQHIGDINNDGANDALADNWPLFSPGLNNQQVSWEFDSDHDSNGNNLQFVHVLEHSEINVSRFQDNANAANESTVDITSANLTDLNQSLVIGSSITNGQGQAYGRGWRNYYLNSTTEAAHWTHRNGNNMQHEIQIIDFQQLRPPSCITTVNVFPYSESFESGLGQWSQNNIDDNSNWIRNTGTTPTSNTGPNSAANGTHYLYLESSSPFNNNAILESQCLDLTAHPNHEFSFSYHMYGSDTGSLRLELSTNGQTFPNVLWSETGEVQTNSGDVWNTVSVDLSAFSGRVVRLRFNAITGNGARSDIAIDDISLIETAPRPEIDVKGNDVSITNGDSTPGINDDTDFDVTDLGTPISRTYTIENSGNAPLNISSINFSNPAFSLSGTSYSSVVPSLGSTSFTVEFDADNLGTELSVVTVNSNDNDEGTFTFSISARSELFFDSDGDGVFDRNDLDDDNDGILDGEECGFVSANNFSGITSGTSGDLSGFSTTFTPAPGNSRIVLLVLGSEYSPNDSGLSENAVVTLGGVTMNQLGISYGKKRRANDDNNYLAVYYLRESELASVSNSNLVVNSVGIDQAFAGHIETLENVDQTVTIYNEFFSISPDDEIVTFTSPTVNLNLDEVAFMFANSGSSGSTYSFSNAKKVAEIGASGSSLGGMQYYPTTAGPITFQGTVDISRRSSGVILKFKGVDNAACADTDGDGVGNHLDLDSDNDGIPDIIEAGYAQYSGGKGFIQGFTDTNNNGVHDATESLFPLNSDGDAAPNYLDLDSDNDSIFDVDESGAGNLADLNFQNGDGDVDGDGVGDGADNDNVRRLDNNNDGVIEFFPDGILDVYDFFEGTTFSTAYGNDDQGLGNTQFVVDTDGDGSPDYIDLTSNGSSFDIADTPYNDLDANSDGIIDGIGDLDKDGLLNVFDTDDARFGSPRDLDKKLLIYFDGRNDYVEDVSVFGGDNEATLMCWLRVDPNASGMQYIIGQNSINIRFTNNNRVYAGVNGYALQSTSMPKGQWIHASLTYSNLSNSMNLYINGEMVEGRSVNQALNADTSPFTMGRRAGVNSNYFNGHLDEVRLFNKALSADEIHKIVYQEIENNGGNIRGREIPLNVTNFIDENNKSILTWNSLLRYYRLDNFKGDITDNLTTSFVDTGTGAKLYNIKTINHQSAPMPFVTQRNGSLEAALTISEDGVNGQDAIDYDWSIVRIEHALVNYNDNSRHLGLFVNELDTKGSPIEFSVQNDSELAVSWYLKLDGTIDLEGESQLVQGFDSTLDPASSGRIERDQQGTADTYTYNYWSSPVGVPNSITNNGDYELSDVLRDGSHPNSPITINFVSSRDGAPSYPISISNRWLYRYNNLPGNDYSQWRPINENTMLSAGEGFTMKGPGTGGVSDDQNYTFIGKPNNGDVALSINNGYNYLIGNPYPSAIDAVQFILDNSTTVAGAEPSITGTLYFWEHWGGGSHVLSEYQGGYATYNLSGSTPAATYASNHPDVASGGTPLKRPGRYIPVAQGFFVEGAQDGTVNFNNGQRVFMKEANNVSVFLRNASEIDESTDKNREDDRMKIRLGFNSVNQFYRELLLTIDDNATPGFDYGYDGAYNEDQTDDMYWLINQERYVIQGSNDVSESITYPIGVHVGQDGLNTIDIVDLEHVPLDIELYIHDIENDTYHDLRASEFQFFLPAGEYLDRFALTFSNSADGTLNAPAQLYENLDVFYTNTTECIGVFNPNSIEIKSIDIYNLVGQSISEITDISKSHYVEYPVRNLSAGTYLINLTTVSGSVSKKIVVR